MRTTKTQAQAIQRYIIDSISERYDVVTTTDRDKLQFLYDTFKQEVGWNIDRIGIYRAFTEYIQGLPTILNIEYMNYDILELARRIGTLSIDASEQMEDRILENYWNYITVHTFKLFKRYKIDSI